MALLFSCRACGAANCGCGRDCSGPVRHANLPSPSYKAAPYAQADANGSRTAKDNGRLAEVAEALRSASAVVNKERLLRDRSRHDLCANGQTREARRVSMKL